jgi:hypothetical protein
VRRGAEAACPAESAFTPTTGARSYPERTSADARHGQAPFEPPRSGWQTRGGLESVKLASKGSRSRESEKGCRVAAQRIDRPNVLLILADDVGWFDVGAYHRGLMGYMTAQIGKNQPTQQQVDLGVVLTIAMCDTRHAPSTLAWRHDS